jgi:hypothetical protein
MDPSARAHRDMGQLSESRAASHEDQHSGDRKDSTDFHSDVPPSKRIQRPARRTANEASAGTHVSGKTCELRLGSLAPLLS